MRRAAAQGLGQRPGRVGLGRAAVLLPLPPYLAAARCSSFSLLSLFVRNRGPSAEAPRSEGAARARAHLFERSPYSFFLVFHYFSNFNSFLKERTT